MKKSAYKRRQPSSAHIKESIAIIAEKEENVKWKIQRLCRCSKKLNS